jgi:hypothetical protein
MGPDSRRRAMRLGKERHGGGSSATAHGPRRHRPPSRHRSVLSEEIGVGDINLEVWDATGNKRLKVQVPDDVAVERILMVLADKLHLPRYAPDGQLMSYKFHHRRLGVQLLDDKSLVDQQVIEADIVRIQPEITAGAGPAGARVGG